MFYLQIKVYFFQPAIQGPPESSSDTFAASGPANLPYALIL